MLERIAWTSIREGNGLIFSIDDEAELKVDQEKQ